MDEIHNWRRIHERDQSRVQSWIVAVAIYALGLWCGWFIGGM